MSVIKRLGNLAKGTLKTWSDDDEGPDRTDVDRAAAEDELRRLEAEARRLDGKAAEPRAPAKAPPSPAASPIEAKRKAIAKAYIDGVLSAEERDAKLAEVQAEAEALDRGDPPAPRKRTL
jgi:hypothetical protein